MIRKQNFPDENSLNEEGASLEPQREQFIHELYQLADEVIRIYADHDVHERHRSKWAAQRLARLTKAHIEGDTGGAVEGPHDWLLDALDDLELYAREKDLDTLRELFLATRMQAFSLLRQPTDGSE